MHCQANACSMHTSQHSAWRCEIYSVFSHYILVSILLQMLFLLLYLICKTSHTNHFQPKFCEVASWDTKGEEIIQYLYGIGISCLFYMFVISLV